LADSKTRPPIGREINRWRRLRGLTLANVAEASGLNIGYLSQIENDKAVPSLDALYALAAALHVSAAWLLLDTSSAPRVVRASERPVLREEEGGRLTEVDAGRSRDLHILEGYALPGSRTGEHAHAGDEHHVVLEGRWRFTQGQHQVEVGPGDYLALDAAVPHDAECIGDEPGRILIVYPRRDRRTEGGHPR
jgi:transcriptional regulator with XRE-family HTH domain